ncbi:MAG: DUF1109 family protein [Deltaproteobacteria bacterium]|nr:DUF1109 family protein [Deltaproteobacteria bacterium]
MTEIDEQLAGLSSESPAPDPAAELLRMVEADGAARRRQPWRQLALSLVVGLGLAIGALFVLGLRRDLSHLPVSYLVSAAIAWLTAIAVVGALAFVPSSKTSLPRVRMAAFATVVSGLFFIALGLLWTEAAPGHSFFYQPGAGQVLRYAPYCLSVGTATSLVPLALGALLLRRTVPIDTPWMGAAIGALGGCIGGLLLHFHCDIAEPTHFGLVHGGVVVVAAGLGALVLPRRLAL